MSAETRARPPGTDDKMTGGQDPPGPPKEEEMTGEEAAIALRAVIGETGKGTMANATPGQDLEIDPHAAAAKTATAGPQSVEEIGIGTVTVKTEAGTAMKGIVGMRKTNPGRNASLLRNPNR